MRKYILATASILLLSAATGFAQEPTPDTGELRRRWLRALRESSSSARSLAAARFSADDIRDRKRVNRELALASTTPFIEPRTIRSVNGFFAAELAVKYADFMIGEHKVRLRTYNDSLVGPTLRVRPGDVMEITLRNDLPTQAPSHGGHNRFHDFNTTNLHTHGLHVSPRGRADNVLLKIKPGETFNYRIEIPDNHPPGTFWYHAHKHGSVAAQVSSGMSGAIIVEGGLDDIPEIAAARDRIFVLQQIPYILEHGIGVVEERYAALSFGPGTWDGLGRHTTINGQLFPELTLTIGELERWRLIHSGVREGMALRLEGVDGNAKGKSISLHEIAWDGLPLEEKRERSATNLFPGYRSDVLVKPEHDGTYLLVDDVIKPAVTGFTQDANFHPKYIAKVVVRKPIEQVDMPLPKDDQLKEVRNSISILKDLRNESTVGKQTAIYSINEVDMGVEFVIDKQAFSDSIIRPLELGAVDQWTLRSVNGVGAVDHPFHIHVNPFQIVKVFDDTGEPIDGMTGWRDTLLLRNDWTYIVRMKYHEPFTGRFVQHCHILDHEDLGMMELVEILPKGAFERVARNRKEAIQRKLIDWRLRTPENRSHRLSNVKRPVVAILYQGHGCLHCVEQLQAFASRINEFNDVGVELIAISPESCDDLKTALKSYGQDFPFTLLSDPQRRAFGLLGCNQEARNHGTFLLDEQGVVVWGKTSDRPFTDVDQVFVEISKMKRSVTRSHSP